MNAPDLSDYLARPSEVEAELRRLFRREAPLVIFDVGACEGEESVRYSRLFPHARILSFEPLPANQELVRANFARYRVATAELVPLALSDRSGEARFFVSSGRPPVEFSGQDWNYGNKSSSLLPPAGTGPMHGWIDFKQEITVPTETLDRLCEQRNIRQIDFMHLDVQGAEHLVLAGADRMLPHIGALWLEVAEQPVYRGQLLRPAIERQLVARGFAPTLSCSRGIEGDQLYVNLRHLRHRLYRLAFLGRRALGRLRMTAGRLKHAARLP